VKILLPEDAKNAGRTYHGLPLPRPGGIIPPFPKRLSRRFNVATPDSQALPDPSSVTQLLVQATAGDRTALDRLMPVVYDELRRIASRRLAGEGPGHTLQTTALVNEAYLRLVDQRQLAWQNRAHFFAIAARLMRYIVVDHARSRKNQKRGGHATHVTLDDALTPAAGESVESLLLIDDALSRLEQVDARKCQVAELRLFSGLSVDETADVLRVSAVTVMRDWRMAKAWLQRELAS
jgi:RNA polymerase sigma-70 factor, ECF subfamily